MAVASRRQQQQHHSTTNSTTPSTSMAHSRSYATTTMSSSRHYESSRQYDSNSQYYGQTTSSYISGSEYGSNSRPSSRDTWERDTWEDLPASAVYPPSETSSSVYTYDSSLSETDEPSTVNFSPSNDDDMNNNKNNAASLEAAFSSGVCPSALPPNRFAPMSPESSVRASDPDSFARLFPSMDRLSIRHDDRTADGNMNLRVDTVVSDPSSLSASSSSRRSSSHRHRPVAVQLFHLRMHDLARREFSLRRYSRDSGREVCNSKGAKPTPSSSSVSSRPGFQRSVSTALRSVKTSFRRSSGTEKAAAAAAGLSSSSTRRPSTASNSSSWGCGSVFSVGDAGLDNGDDDEEDGSGGNKPPSARPIPANTIKLEFSNYARVDIVSRGAGPDLGGVSSSSSSNNNRRYEFEWWGHRYAWRRVVDRTTALLGSVSFQLVRDGQVDRPVALIVPEGRSPNQVEADRIAGEWVPPCYMWICDPTVLDAMTDVADVIIATGLMALVDDAIKQRWPGKKAAAARPIQPIRPHFLHLTGGGGGDGGARSSLRPRNLMHGLFNRTRSGHYNFSPLRFGHHPVVAY